MSTYVVQVLLKMFILLGKHTGASGLVVLILQIRDLRFSKYADATFRIILDGFSTSNATHTRPPLPD